MCRALGLATRNDTASRSCGRRLARSRCRFSVYRGLSTILSHTDESWKRDLPGLASALGCDYSDLWMVDTHPTLIDFARFRRPERVKARRWPARASQVLLYPILLLTALAYLTSLWVYEVFMRGMTVVEFLPFALAIPTLFVAWHRGREYFARRYARFQINERDRTAGSSPAG